MLTIPQWTLHPADPVPGQAGPLTIVDGEHQPVRPSVCIVPGSLVHSTSSDNSVRLLDEDDIANARLIAAAPRMLRVLDDLASWARDLGGWDAPCWQELDAIGRAARGDDPSIP